MQTRRKGKTTAGYGLLGEGKGETNLNSIVWYTNGMVEEPDEVSKGRPLLLRP